MFDNAHLLSGYHLIEDEKVGKPMPQYVDRSWKERLFTLPWRPFRKQKIITVFVPKGEYFLLKGQGCLVAHPQDIEKLKIAIQSYSKNKTRR